jgi:hypothetical protein
MAWENGCDSFSMPTRASRALVKGEKIILKSLFTFFKNNYTSFKIDLKKEDNFTIFGSLTRCPKY